MDKNPQFETPAVEQSHIEGRVQEQHESLENIPSPEESKEIVKDVITDHIAQVPDDTTATAFDDLSDDKDQVHELVNIAFKRGIAEAVKVARAIKNPKILDDFHDVLTDHFYEKMVAAKLIPRREDK